MSPAASETEKIADSSGRRVGLRAVPRRPPRTFLEELVLSVLQRDRTMLLEDLAERVAGALYADALRHGAGALDIGFFGAKLFVPAVVREVEEGHGTLWEIQPPEGER